MRQVRRENNERKTDNLPGDGGDLAAGPCGNDYSYVIKMHRHTTVHFSVYDVKSRECKRTYNIIQIYTLIFEEKCGKIFHDFGFKFYCEPYNFE